MTTKIFSNQLYLLDKNEKKLSLSKNKDSTASTVSKKAKASSSPGEATISPESSSSSEMTDGTSGQHTSPHQIQSAPRNQDLITPHKPTLYEHTAKYLSNHFSMSINQDCVIMKANQVVTIPSEIRHWLIDSFSSEKDKFKSSIITSFNPDHPFRKICEIILYDL